METEKEQMMQEKEVLMLRLQNYKQKMNKGEKEFPNQVQRALQLEEERKHAQEEAEHLQVDHIA